MKIQTECLYFIKVQKPPDEDAMSKINEQMQKENKKSQTKNKGRASNNEVFGVIAWF